MGALHRLAPLSDASGFFASAVAAAVAAVCDSELAYGEKYWTPTATPDSTATKTSAERIEAPRFKGCHLEAVMSQSCAPHAPDAMHRIDKMWKKPKMCYIFTNAPVVQWIGYILAEDTMLVRFQPGAQNAQTPALRQVLWFCAGWSDVSQAWRTASRGREILYAAAYKIFVTTKNLRRNTH